MTETQVQPTTEPASSEARAETQETQTSKERSSIEREITLNNQLATYDYGNIRSDPNLSNEGRLRKLEEVHEQATRKHKQIVAKLEAQEQARRTQLEQEIFSAPSPGIMASSGDKAQHYVSLRDALSRAESAHEKDFSPGAEKRDASYLSELLTRAELTGDENLAYAAFQIARENGRESIVSQYLSARPDKQEKYSELRSLRTEGADALGLMVRAMHLTPPPKPPELLGRNW